MKPAMTQWSAAQVATIALTADVIAPLIGSGDFAPVDACCCVWDAWPVLTESGAFPRLPDGAQLWMALASPWFDDPDERHGHARIHLIERTAAGWQDHGPAMPDGFSPGSREWSGSAVLAQDGKTVTLYFTAAGSRGESVHSFSQRLFQARATLHRQQQAWGLGDWRELTESVVRDNRYYMDPQAGSGSVGTIKAFRDPAYFRDPATGQELLFFTGSLAGTGSAFNGAIGAAVAHRDAAGWIILPPIVGADGLNNELERPHVIARGGLYYLFWSTQAHVFNPDAPPAPTGLYGMVSTDLFGGWQPLNGSGLVIANPPQAPQQAYSWLVLPDLSVTSFVDNWRRRGDGDDVKRLGGSFAPFLQIDLDGARSRIVPAHRAVA